MLGPLDVALLRKVLTSVSGSKCQTKGAKLKDILCHNWLLGFTMACAGALWLLWINLCPSILG